MSLAILTPNPGDDDRYDDWREQAKPIVSLLPGVDVAFRPWTAPFEPAALTLPVMAWGYHRHLARWYDALDAWEAGGARFANPLPVLRWNTDKRYLLDLEARGVSIVPTVEVARLDATTLAEARAGLGASDIVVKPPVSAGSDRTFRLGPSSALPPAIVNQRMLVQPMMAAVNDPGELSLFYLGSELAHAIVKRARPGDFRVQPQFGGQVSAIDPPRAALDAAECTLAACSADLLYARIDLIADGHHYRLMEIELIEPWLYLDHARDGGAAFGRAIRKALDTAAAALP